MNMYTAKLQAVDLFTINFGNLWPKVTLHNCQISPSQFFRKCLGVLLTETVYCLRLYGILRRIFGICFDKNDY